MQRLENGETAFDEGEALVEAFNKSMVDRCVSAFLLHPSVKRGKVWCRACGVEQKIDPEHSLRNGWPKCCGYTMTIDSPEERT